MSNPLAFRSDSVTVSWGANLKPEVQQFCDALFSRPHAPTRFECMAVAEAPGSALPNLAAMRDKGMVGITS